jgi:uncharacterized protein YkwD
VHHLPDGPRKSSRIGGWALLFVRRVLPALLVAGAVTGIALSVPMVSRAMTGPTDPASASADSAVATEVPAESPAAAPAEDPSSRWATTTPGESAGPVQMGVDGLPPEDAASAAPGAPDAGETPTSAAPAPTASAEQSAAAAAEKPAVVAETPSGTVSAPPAAVPVTAPSEEAAVLELVNAARSTAGCDPLVADAGLAAVARAHSADMRDRDYFSHTDPEGRSPFDRAEEAGIADARAENIAYGQADASAVMASWMGSAGHKANILDCSLRTLGVGVAEGAGGPWWTQLFGA